METALIVIAAVAAFFCARQLTQKFLSKNIDDKILKMANKMNRQTPLMVDKHTRLDNITPGPSKAFTYNYTILDVPRRELDKEWLRGLKATVTNKITTADGMKVYFKNGVTISYVYHDETGKQVGKFSIRPSDAGC